MSRVEELISQLCPDGVISVRIGDIADIANRGVDKVDSLGESEVRLLNYTDIPRNWELTDSVPTAKTTASKSQITECDLRVGDILITPTSETRDDLAHASVVVSPMPQTVYSYHVMRIRIIDSKKVNSKFLAYQFRSARLQDQIISASNGITRFGLTKPKWESLIFELPPIEIQHRIVEVLDRFSELKGQLQESLEAELTARNTQYVEFRRRSLAFSEETTNTSWAEIGEVCSTFSGAFVKKTKQNKDFEYPVFNGGASATGYYSEYNSPADSIAISARGATCGAVNWVPTRFWAGNSCHVVLSIDPRLNNRFLYHYLKFHEPSLHALRSVGSIPAFNLKPLLKFRIPLPPLEQQEKIIDAMDSYESLINGLLIDIPSEIVARDKEYEYYRNKLLTFNVMEVA